MCLGLGRITNDFATVLKYSNQTLICAGVNRVGFAGFKQRAAEFQAKFNTTVFFSYEEVANNADVDIVYIGECLKSYQTYSTNTQQQNDAVCESSLSS